MTEEETRNRFTCERKKELVVTFGDGWKWIPSLTARRALVWWFGSESDN